MKCIDKKRMAGALGLLLSFVLLCCGCGREAVPEDAYDVYETTRAYGLNVPSAEEADSDAQSFFAEGLCVAGDEDLPDPAITDSLSEAAGLFDLNGKKLRFGKNIHERLYPASTTKILTAYVALKYGDLSAKATVTEEELQLEAGSTTCGLSVGDTISLEDLLYGLLLCSGNDAANVIADLVSGSTEAFAERMNQEARALGATNSHFVNAHGLHDEEHYTTVYDLYLIFQAAVQEEKFVEIIHTPSHTGTVTNAAGETVSKEWSNTNKYISGDAQAPEGVEVVGGKTGTTNAAGYCLALYSKKQSDGSPYISIVYKSDSRNNLYYEMSEILEKILK